MVLLIPVGMYMYSITNPLALIRSPAAIWNLPINLFCSLETALVLTSDDFHSNFPPSPHSYPLSGGTSPKKLTWCHLYRMFTYIYSLLIKKDICDC